MSLTGNKGEWSEIYVLFKLLGDTKLYLGNEKLEKIEKIFYPIIKILRQESDGIYEFSINSEIIIKGEKEKLSIPISVFKEKAYKLLNTIKSSSGASFSIPEIENFMKTIHCKRLKAVSTDKTDIKIIIHDINTNLNPTLGFSIKSQLGGASSLLNAGKNTNFIYTIEGKSFDKGNINKINLLDTKSKIRDRLNLIEESIDELIYLDIEGDIFKNNLILIDSLLPNIISVMLKKYYSTGVSKISDLTEMIEKENPLKYDKTQKHEFYKYKIKHFLTDIALGLMPSKVWEGIFEANGGYLVVKEDGEVLCYHVYNKNEFENYLYYNTKFETASSTRHDFGKIKLNKGKIIFKLNLQIRFL